MRNWLRTWIYAPLQRWLDRRVGPTVVLRVLRDDLFEVAVDYVQEVEQLQEASGEYKRHRVYAKLMKHDPSLSARQISLLIEAALQVG